VLQNQYIIYIAFGILLLLSELIWFRLAKRYNIIDKPNQRSSHSRITLQGGGIVFYFGVLLYSLWFKIPYPWFLAGLTLIAAISLIDDIRKVPNSFRVILHFMAMLLLFNEWGLYSGLPWWYSIIALVFCTGIINAYNFMDGINGITGGYSFIVLLALIWINAEMTPFINSSFLYTVLLSLLVFNLFNFRKRAICFAGDVGSITIAFILLFVLVRLMLASGDLSYIILLGVYGVDSVLTIVHRLLLKENIFVAHRKHAYQIMANELKIPHLQVSGFYMLLQALTATGYLLIPLSYRWYYLISVLVLLGFLYILFMKRFFHLHNNSSVNYKTVEK